jgi:hypothetical protein
MTTFYLLPPRPFLDDALARFRDAWLPGLAGLQPAWPTFAELLDGALAGRPDVCVIFRDELPDGPTLDEVLRDGYGAGAGDRVVEVRAGAAAGEARVRSWRLDGSLVAPVTSYNHG